MNVLLLGSNYFQKALTLLGVRTCRAGSDAEADVRLPPGDFHLGTVIKQLPFEPEAVILTDDLGRRVLPWGLEDIQALKVYYAVDGPLNLYWQRHYATLFDLVLADQKRTAEVLNDRSPNGAVWLPVAVETEQYQGPPERAVWDLAFVGAVNDAVRPKRSRILEILAARYNVKTAGGRRDQWVSPREAGRLYRGARMVLNENLFDGVTTRMFEAMASGALLFTEDGDGLTDLFDIGEDLAVFGPENLVERAEYYLGREETRLKMARQGREKVLAGHDVRHRADWLLAKLDEATTGTRLSEGRAILELGRTYFLAGMRWPDHDGAQRLRRAEFFLERAEALGEGDREAAFFLGVLAGQRGDWKAARKRLVEAAEAGSLRARLGLGYLALDQGAPAAARPHFNQAAAAAGLEFPARFDGGRLSASQHLALGRILKTGGHDLTPGFSRYRSETVLWNAVEHFQAAVNLEPASVEALAELGRVLADHGAYVEAHHFYQRAMEIAPGYPGLAEEAGRAARLGYAGADFVRKVA